MSESARQSVVEAASNSRAARTRRARIMFRLQVAAVAVLIILAAAHDKFAAVRDYFIPKRFDVVEPGRVYRSGQISANLVRGVLEKHGIRAVVDLTFDNPDDANHQAELAAIAELGIERRLCPLNSDGTGDVRVYAEAVAAIVAAERAGKPVLVHCAAGAQRTGGVIAVYRLLVQGRSVESAIAEMESHGYNPEISPKLVRYLQANLPAIAWQLQKRGVIARIPDPFPCILRCSPQGAHAN
jgi:protein tyrosine/serine phosphatase